MATRGIARVRKYRGPQIRGAIESQLQKQMKKAAIHLRTQVRKLISKKNPTGSKPSASGEPPRRFTGELWRSIETSVMFRKGIVVAEVGVEEGSSAEEYAARLEKGFVGTDSLGRNVNQRARPFISRALKEQRQKILDIISVAAPPFRRRIRKR